MNESEIDEVEKKYQIKFPPDHREFLKILHTINAKPTIDGYFFFNWLEDEQIIFDKLNWPSFSISRDRVWLQSWGIISDSQDVITNRFNEWYCEAPKLIPIFGHRYIVSQPYKSGNPILSVYGSDTIVYGWDLKQYLLTEFSKNMPDELFEEFYDNEDGNWSYNYKSEIQDIFNSNWLNSHYENISHWGELIKQYEGSWKYQSQPK